VTTPTTGPSLAPPHWSQLLLRAVVPSGAMRDAIFGDLHEELLQDAEDVGTSLARFRYARRVTGIALHATFDALRQRSWASAPPTSDGRPEGVAPTAIIAASHVRAAGGGAVIAIVVLAVLSIGVVASTFLFSAVHGADRTATAGSSASSSALAVGAVALALACSSGAAIVLCVGPRWLRRRLRRT
jgi:hypothetical protein